MLTREQAKQAKENMAHYVKVYMFEDGPKNYIDPQQFIHYTLSLAKAAYKGYVQYDKEWDGEWVVYQAKRNMTTKSGTKILRGDYVIGRAYIFPEGAGGGDGYIQIPVFRNPFNSLSICVFKESNFKKIGA